MKKNTKRLTSALLAMTLAAGASFSCIFASAASGSVSLTGDESNGNVMSIPAGDEPQVTFSTDIKDANSYSMNVSWGSLEFKYEFSHSGGVWSGNWSTSSFDGANNKITVENKGTGAIKGTISYDSLTSNDVGSLDLGINIGTEETGTPDQIQADVELAAPGNTQDAAAGFSTSQDYYLYSNADLAKQANENGKHYDDLDFSQTKAGIVKIEVSPDTSRV